MTCFPQSLELTYNLTVEYYCSYMLSVLIKASPTQYEEEGLVISNPLALYEGGLPTFTEGYEDKGRVYLYWALEEVNQRLHIDAMYTGKHPFMLR